MEHNSVENAEDRSHRADTHPERDYGQKRCDPAAPKLANPIRDVLPQLHPIVAPASVLFALALQPLACSTNPFHISELPTGLFARRLRRPAPRNQLLHLRLQMEGQLIVHISLRIRPEEAQITPPQRCLPHYRYASEGRVACRTLETAVE